MAHRFSICIYNTEAGAYDTVGYANTWDEVAAFGDPSTGNTSASLRYHDAKTGSWGWCCEV